MRKNKEVFPYIVVLKQRYRFLLGIIGIISGLIYIFSLLIRIMENESTRIINILLIIVASALFISQFIRFRKGKKAVFKQLFILASITLLIIPPFNPLFILFVILALLEKPATTPEEIGFSDDKIVWNGFFKKTIPWSELKNIVLKDGIITLDYHNNKLIQRETDDDDEEEDYDVSEDEFNQFCSDILIRNSEHKVP